MNIFAFRISQIAKRGMKTDKIRIICNNMLNIIYLSQKKDRLELLKNQLTIQEISDYKLWEGIVDQSNPAKVIPRVY